MQLWDADRWEVNYCLVDTPDRLIGFESPMMHFVSSYPEHHRVTSWVIERDKEKESLIEVKVKAAQEYFYEVIREFDQTHQQKG